MATEKMFPTLWNSQIDYLEIKSKRDYYYQVEDEKIVLMEKKLDELSKAPIYSIVDKNRKWNDYKRTQSIYFDLTFSISNLVHIFHGDNPVCFSNTTLGIALEWKPKSSKVKKCIKIGDISDYIENDTVTFSINNIEIESPCDDVDFYWIIYISKPGSGKLDGEKRYGNKKGLILGRGLLWSLISSGNASMFPIEEIAKKDAPLWSIRCSFIDWCTDEFSQDNLAIILNRCHPLYKMIDMESETYDDAFFKEVISSSFAALIEQIILISKDNGDYADLEKEGIEEKGSILAAVKYFKNGKNISINGLPSELFDSVKKIFDKEKSL